MVSKHFDSQLLLYRVEQFYIENIFLEFFVVYNNLS